MEKTFTVKENPCVGFDSKWKVKRIITEGGSQTNQYSSRETSTNTSQNTDVQTQTLEPENAAPEVDMQRLADFLQKIFPKVQKQLTEATNSRAFDGCYSFESSEQPEAKLQQILTMNSTAGDIEQVLNVSALAWNSTGNTLAASCTHTHNSWCHHSGQVNLYMFNRDDKLPENPNKKLITPACVTVLKFHPSVPSVLACGTYSGEILIWNVQHDEGDNVVVRVDGHEEKVTDMSWMHDIDPQKTLLLATSSLDGCLTLWNFSLPSSALTIKHKYKIKSPVLARIKQSHVPEEIAKKVVRGVLSFDFSLYIPDMFVVGVEGGLVVQCSMVGINKLKESTKEVPVYDPIFKYYEPHEGEIILTRFTPNRKDMFMTSATDGEIRVYMISEEDSPARVIFQKKPLNWVSWVPYQEKLVVGCGEGGLPEIFHLISGHPVANITNDKVSQTTLLYLAVNKQRSTTLAIGNDRGEIHVWTVPWGLFALQKQYK